MWTHICRLRLQLVEAHAVLEDADERVRLDAARKGKRLGVAQPAPRQLQRCIAEAGFLEVAPDCVQRSATGGRAHGHSGVGHGTEIVDHIAAEQRHDILRATARVT